MYIVLFTILLWFYLWNGPSTASPQDSSFPVSIFFHAASKRSQDIALSPQGIVNSGRPNVIVSDLSLMQWVHRLDQIVNKSIELSYRPIP